MTDIIEGAVDTAGDVLTALVDDVEKIFPPKPGGLVDSIRKEREAEKAANAAMTAKPSSRAARAIAVRTQEPEISGAFTVVVSNTGNSVARLLGQDNDRKRAVIMTLDEPVVIANGQSMAYDTRNADNTYGVSSQSAVDSATDPGSFDGFAFTNSVPAGTYEVTATVYLSGTVTSADANNMQITGTGFDTVRIAYPGVIDVPVTITATVTTTAAGGIGVQSINAASGSGAVYNASIVVTPVSTAGQTAGGFVLPVNVPMVIESRSEAWAAATSSTPTRVSVWTENYAD